jgi:hypothetical protein
MTTPIFPSYAAIASRPDQKKTGAPGLQSGQQFGQNLGASMDSANPPTVISTGVSFLQIYAAHPF